MIFGLLLAGCAFSNPLASPTPEPSETPRPSPTRTLTPTLMPGPTQTPTAVPVARLGTPLPLLAAAISPANAGRLTLAAAWGRGIAQAAAWSPDGQRVAVASTHGIYVFDSQSLAESAPAATFPLYEDLSGTYHSLAFAPGSQLLAVGAEDGRISVWSPNGALTTFSGQAGPITALTFSADSQYLASAAWDGSLRVWNVADGTLAFGLLAGNPLSRLAFSGDDSRLYTWSSAEQPQVYAVPGGEKLKALYVGADSLGQSGSSAAFSAGGELLAVAQGYRVRVQRTGNGTTFTTLNSLPDPVLLLAISHDGGLIAVLDKKRIRVWDTASGKHVTRQDFSLAADEALPRGLQFSPDDSQLLAFSSETLRIYPVDGKSAPRQLPPGSFTSAYRLLSYFSPDGSGLAAQLLDGKRSVLDLTSGSFVAPVRLFQSAINQTARAAGFTLFAGALADQRLALSTGGAEPPALLKGNKRMASALSLSPDEKTLAASTGDANVHIWDVASAQETRKLQAPGNISGLAFSPDGTLLAAMLLDQSVLWRTHDWSVEPPVPGSPLIFAPGGGKLAYSTRQGGAWVTQIQTIGGKAQPSLLPASSVRMAFSPDASLLALSAQTLTVWDAADGKQLAELANPAPFGQVLFSPDGRLLVITDWDGVAYSWAVE